MKERFLVQAENDKGQMFQAKYCFIENAILARRSTVRLKGIIRCAIYEIVYENERVTELKLKRL